MTYLEYIKEQEAEWRKRFSNHMATAPLVRNDQSIILIHWQQPNKWAYGARIILHSQWLVMMGDLFEATYQWSEEVTLKFLGQTDFSYFFSKLRASEKGREWMGWSMKVAEPEMKRIHGDLPEEWIDRWNEWHGAATEEDCAGFADAYHESGGDYEIAGEIKEAGKVPCSMAIGHWVAIKMISERLSIEEA